MNGKEDKIQICYSYYIYVYTVVI